MIGNNNGREVGEEPRPRPAEPEPARPPADTHRPSEETQETNLGDKQQAQCHIFTYESPWKSYALGYSWRPDQPFRFGLGSFLEDKTNKVRLFTVFLRKLYFSLD